MRDLNPRVWVRQITVSFNVLPLYPYPNPLTNKSFLAPVDLFSSVLSHVRRLYFARRRRKAGISRSSSAGDSSTGSRVSMETTLGCGSIFGPLGSASTGLDATVLGTMGTGFGAP